LITHFCRHCWHEIEASASRCPFCGKATQERLPYREELELALRCPEAFTARRAAFLLGELADAASVPALAGTLASGDPYVAEEAVRSLARIGTPEALALVEQGRAHRFVTVRAAAKRLLSRRDDRPK
jgi:HEAT repeat protein